MVEVLQIFGALFGFMLIYFSFLNLKRREFTINEWIFWTAMSAVFMFLSIFPEILNPVVSSLNIGRKLDLLIITGFMFLIAVSFYTYRVSMRNQKKIEDIVRKIAIDEAGKKRK
ncbi:DUF2304 domain-containing protein [Candidatus Woesearchaeota archaeon]|nr:DUF2304 domain-containing protein [Candidatus Woesearchaeota archaeon]